MGLMSQIKKFFENRRQKTLEKNETIIKNRKAIKEDRVAAIEYFANHKDPLVATKCLLQRFTFSLEQGIQDGREKQKVLDSILAFGEKALVPTIEHLKASHSIAWPVKIISKLGTQEELQNALWSALTFGDIDFSQELVNKNYDILCHLRNQSLGDKSSELFQFLNAHDERLRLAATEAILHQNEEKDFQKLEKFLLDDSPENIRLKQSIADKFIELKRPLFNTKLFKTGFLHPDFVINKDYTLKHTSSED